MKTFFMWVAIVGFFAVLFNMTHTEPRNTEEIKFSEFIHDVELDDIKEVTFKTNGDIVGTYTKPHGKIVSFTTTGDTTNPEVFKILMAHKIVPNYDFQKSNAFTQLLIALIPMGIMVLVIIYIMNKATGSQGKLSSFGQTKARLVTKSLVTFDDVAGHEEAKEDLKEIVDYLKNPDKYVKMGAKIPRGVLMEGPPGTGKSLMAKAVAGEADVNFFIASGSEFVEMFVGVGASRVRDLFEQARKNSPCIIFIDEIDAVGKKRGTVGFGGHDEKEQTLNQLLSEMDGFLTGNGVIVMGATNRVDVLDSALTRPGRFDRKITMSNPDMKSRKAILDVHAKGKPIDSSVDLSVVARGTPGFSGADLANLVNESVLLAVRRSKSTVTSSEFEDARDKILMGPERKTLKFSEDERKSTSYHESGHVLVNKLLPGLDPIHRVTIIPRGSALGLTQTLPIDDRVSMSKDKAEKTLAFLMGGRAAEELVLNQFTSGASNDIERATELAELMVMRWGMSPLGPVHYKKKNPAVSLAIDSFLDAGYNQAKKLLGDNIDKLHTLAKELLDKESLTGDEVSSIVG